MTARPSVSALICGADDSSAVAHTRHSVGASDYPGELEILAGRGGNSSLRPLPADQLAAPGAIARENPEPAVRPGQRMLWIAPRLPDPRRSGVDARHFNMMKALRGQGRELTVVAAHGTHDALSGGRLDALGISRISPPAAERWNLDPRPEPWLEDFLGARRWDTVLVADLHMAGSILPMVERQAGSAQRIIDLGTVRFPAAHVPGAGPDLDDPRIDHELSVLGGADGVVAATEQDRRLVELVQPALPTFVWSARGEDIEPTHGGVREGPLLYIGDLFHHPNAQGLEYWLDIVAARVEARIGRPVPLRVVGRGSETYRDIWKHPRKINLAGWQPDLSVELARARLLAIPLTYATGTGGRMVTAMAAGLPVATSAPAAALLPGSLAGLVRVGSSPAELSEVISDLLTDDTRWEAARAHILETDIPALRHRQTLKLVEWLASVEPGNRPSDAPAPSRRSGSRRGLRRLGRAS